MFKKMLFGAAMLASTVLVAGSASAALILDRVPGQGSSGSNGGDMDNCDLNCITAAFNAAGITDGNWTLVGQSEVFGQSTSGGNGNGFFNNGGTVQLKLELAGDNNAFGVTNTGSSLVQLLTTSGNNIDDTATFTNPDGSTPTDFDFYFKNLSTNRTCLSSDSECDNGLDMAIYKNGNTFAFFFDDGGNNNDNDYNDMVVTAYLTPTSVPEPMTLGLLGAGLLSLGAAVRRRRNA